jgi:hypothetical protein
MGRLLYFIGIIIVIAGCQQEKKYANMKLACGICNRITYDGPAEVDGNGMMWPTGPINHCKPWDINCVGESSAERAAHFGYKDGRQDALEFRYKKVLDPTTHHPEYIENYEKGYKEVTDLRK